MAKRVEITALAFGGKGVGRIDGKVVFVPYAAPGDILDIGIVSEKKGFSEGVIERIERPSPERVEPPCPYYGECGGCNMQHMAYGHQLEWKQRIFEETLRRIGKVEGVRYDEPIASKREFNYRARARFQAKGGMTGFFGARSHRVVDVESCPLLEPAINETYADIRRVVTNGQMPPINSFEVNLSEQDSRTVAVFHTDAKADWSWSKALEGIRHLKGFEVWLSPPEGMAKRLASEGDTIVSYPVEGINISAGASVFSQVNRWQNSELVKKAVALSRLSGKETAVDLFSGVGNLTLPLARGALRSIGVDSNIEAVREAAENARRNSIKNTEFHAADAADWLKQNLKSLERAGDCVLVLDPPRGGEPEIARSLSGIRPDRIVYISCSPPTLARDVLALAGCGYRVSRAALIDMFPQTYHIESVVSLELAG
ncbi:MAG TPA: class I SAM-dependent RNA methyltransferase [Thermodesulfobacteriota bacterium]